MTRPPFTPRTWTGLLNLAAASEAALLLAVGLLLGDLETIAFGAVVAATTVLLLARHSTPAMLVRLAVFLDVAFWMVAGAYSNLAHGGGLSAVAAPLGLACVSVVGIVASVALLMRRDGTGSAPALVAGTAGLVFAAGLVVAATGGTGAGQRAGQLDLGIKNARYSATELRGRAVGGVVTVKVQNHDLFWHTFTSADLGVDERFASRAGRTISIRARPGTYRFYCAIPGHATIGMRGTLTID